MFGPDFPFSKILPVLSNMDLRIGLPTRRSSTLHIRVFWGRPIPLWMAILGNREIALSQKRSMNPDCIFAFPQATSASGPLYQRPSC